MCPTGAKLHEIESFIFMVALKWLWLLFLFRSCNESPYSTIEKAGWYAKFVCWAENKYAGSDILHTCQ